jgi:hypothetical protein
MDWVLGLRNEIGIPHSLTAIIDIERFPEEIGSMAAADPAAGSNPLVFTPQQYQVILEAAHSGNL